MGLLHHCHVVMCYVLLYVVSHATHTEIAHAQLIDAGIDMDTDIGKEKDADSDIERDRICMCT